MSIIRIHHSETTANRRMRELARENPNRKYAVLHRVFGDAHRYIVGYWVRTNSHRNFVVMS